MASTRELPPGLRERKGSFRDDTARERRDSLRDESTQQRRDSFSDETARERNGGPKNAETRDRRSSLWDTEARQEEEGGRQQDGVVKMVETSPRIKFLKRSFEIGSIVLKLSIAVILFFVLLNMVMSFSYAVLTGERLNIFGIVNSTNNASQMINHTINATDTNANVTNNITNRDR